jgi:hypothetical protein
MAEENVYWAAKTGKDLAKEVMKKVDDYYSFTKKNDVFDLFDRSHKAFYGKPFSTSTGDSSQLLAEGKQDEFLRLNVNHYANFLRHQVNLVLSEKPAFKPVAATTNSEQESQAYQTGPILESYQAKLGMDRHDRDWVLKALMGGEAFKRLEWDSAAGYDYNGVPSGDVRVSILTILDMVSDRRNKSWRIPRSLRNKHDLAAKWPAFADKILAMKGPEQGLTESDRYLDVCSDDERDEDEIAVFELLHERTPALPKGRYAVVLSDDLLLIEDDLPYDSTHVYSLTPEDKVGSSGGHSLAFDLLSLQEAVNHLYSIVFTNQKTFGHQNILSPADANISLQQVSGGLNFIEYQANQWGLKPEPLNLTATPVEIFNFLKQLEMAMETISGINAAARGNAPQNLESGAALAQLDAQAKSFASGLMQSFTNNSESATTGLIQIVKRFATAPQKLALAGEDQTYRIAEFSAETFAFVDSVRAERVSSVMQSTAGKLEVANKLLDGGHVTANQYLTVATSGRLEAMTDSGVKERLAIKRNLEKWRRGEMVPEPVITENHALHIKEESAVLFDDEFRANPAAVEGVTMHLQAHIMLLAHPDPIMQNLLMVLGQQPLMLPPPPPTGGPNDKGSQPKPPGQEPSSAGPAAPGLPSLPNNPSTGEQWDSQTGGGAVTPLG